MNPISKNPQEHEEVERAAASWTLKIDRGLTAEEQDAYSQWLAEDSLHRDAVALYRWGWDEFDRLAGLQTTQRAVADPDLLAPGNRFARKPRLVACLRWAAPAAAALVALFGAFWSGSEKVETAFATKPAVELIARIETRELEDGSMVELNRGAILEVDFKSDERRLRLVSGEAYFTVAKDASRPFVVEVKGVSVRAIGTRFNVRLENESVDVIVSEGIVGLAASGRLRKDGASADEPRLEEGDRAVVALGGPHVIRFSKLTDLQIDEELGWKPRLLDFDDESLAVIVAEFNKRNKVKIVLGESSLEDLRLSSAFWSDNVEGFVRLMESSFGMSAQWRGSTSIELRKSGKTPR